jgi:hypothetical protein
MTTAISVRVGLYVRDEQLDEALRDIRTLANTIIDRWNFFEAADITITTEDRRP